MGIWSKWWRWAWIPALFCVAGCGGCNTNAARTAHNQAAAKLGAKGADITQSKTPNAYTSRVTGAFLKDPRITDDDIDQLGLLDNVRTLALGPSITNQGLRKSVGLVPDLEVLDLSTTKQITVEGLDHLKDLKKLKRVHLPEALAKSGADVLRQFGFTAGADGQLVKP